LVLELRIQQQRINNRDIKIGGDVWMCDVSGVDSTRLRWSVVIVRDCDWNGCGWVSGHPWVPTPVRLTSGRKQGILGQK